MSALSVGICVFIAAVQFKGGGCLRLFQNPTAVPNATGKRIEAAGCSNMTPGRVMDGMYVVIV